MKRHNRPRKAVILAAGFGERMRPLSFDLPKPMMPLWGKPMLGHCFDLLQTFGVEDVLINLHHAPAEIVEYCRREAGKRCFCLNISYEPQILGTGGALRRAAWFIDDSPFWILNADIAADVEPEPFLKAYEKRRCIAVVWLSDKAGPRTVEMERDLITTFCSRRAGTRGTHTFCGLHLVSSEILGYLPESGFASIIDAYLLAMKNGRHVAGVCVPGSFWAEIGTPANYLETHRQLLEQYKKRKAGRCLVSLNQASNCARWRSSGGAHAGFAVIGRNVHAAKGARITNSVVWDDATISANACVEGAIIGRRVTVRDRVEGILVRADVAPDGQLREVLEKLGWKLDKTVVSPFPARGSARSFTRLLCGASSVILMQYSLEREENALYAANSGFLRKIGVPAPRVLFELPSANVIVMEDLGYDSLFRAAERRAPDSLERCYHMVLDAILPLHERGAEAARKAGLKLAPPFSADVYRWEREMFAHHFLKGFMKFRDAQIVPVVEELRTVARRLLKAPPALIHRDLQSSNIFFRNGRPVFIDFQGMRFGPVSYDLASLLCDPYVSLSAELQDRLLEYYICHLREPESVADVFWYAAVQRLCQAIGAFARLGARRETTRFQRYIAPAFLMMDRALERLECPPYRAEMKNLRKLVYAALERRNLRLAPSEDIEFI